VSPSSGATGVDPGTAVTATFDEAIDPATVNGSTVALRVGGTAVTAAVAYDAATRTARLQPSSLLAFATSYTATLAGGSTDPRVKDVAGNALAAVSWSFTTASAPPPPPPPPACPCTVFAASSAPTVAADSDAAAVEVGMKFRSDVGGSITGVRFYKAATNTGTHVGSLWSATGTRLATVTFSGESASGWQQATFSQPVQISANTTYVVSYHTNVGHYSADAGYFNTGIDSPPLHAVANGTSPNGVYAYGASTFPAQTYQASNYWVDVVFTTSP
jgi:hypothetical protein